MQNNRKKSLSIEISLCVVFLLVAFFGLNVASAEAATYYVKNGGNDFADGLSDATAWQTLSKVSGYSFQPGDSILLKRNGIWRESLVVPGNGLTIGAYGTGDKPIISGADVVLGSWTLDSGNIYHTVVSGTVYQVFQNGNWVHLAHEPDNGFFTDDGSTNNYWQVIEIGDDMTYQPSEINGATLLAITEQWQRQVYKINNYDNATDIIYLVQDGRTNPSISLFNNAYVPSPNRYWLAGKRIFLDTANEWYYDKGQSRLYVHQNGGGVPSGVWEIMRRDYGIYAVGKDNLTIANIEVKNVLNGIYLNNCVNFNIDNTDINDIGTQTYLPGWDSFTTSFGIYIQGTNTLLNQAGVIRNSRFNNVLHKSIKGSNYDNVLVEGNTITNNATVGEDVGFGPYGTMNSAINVGFNYESERWTVRNNLIDSTGYCGIIIAKNGVVEGNTILNTMKYLGDGGAIYASEDASGLTIKNNYIDTAKGGYGNTKTGIYIDAGNHDNLIDGNTIFNTEFCLFNHGGSNNVWTNNTCKDYSEYGFYSSTDSSTNNAPIVNLVVKNNKFTSSNSIKSHIVLYNEVIRQAPHASWVSSSDNFDYNIYYPDGTVFFRESYPPVYIKDYNFSNWKSATGLDAHSTITSANDATPPFAPQGLSVE